MKPFKPTIIAIAGPSASGKTLFAQTIHDELVTELGKNGISIIYEDAYYRDQSHLSMQEREQTNYDHPDAFEHELLSDHLIQLTENKTINSPVYCYKTHTRINETKTLLPTKIILIEGILLLSNQELRDCFDIKVYMDTPLDICLIRRIQRDLVERNRSIESVTSQYLATVRPMYHQFIEPSKAWADIVITRGGKNRMAIEVLKAKIRQLSQQPTQ
ncbi:uridine kinase [Colwellia sp. MT41]|uniref:Uridine kinase n=1 Tax=Colwellia marinimaniae TaxID=1513592 RepID=A0ABQ0MY23_9GAMM|nr:MULTISPECIES: uridine kinase [Colwellia]ALO35180.1 uridine kinase [Colwellia sp. MT41]GAW97264.1 uridine kinase [Colwellia marinimaniae]